MNTTVFTSVFRGITNGLFRLVRSTVYKAKAGCRRARMTLGFFRKHRVSVVAYGLFLVILLGGVVSIVLKHVAHLDFLGDFSSFALVLTLAFLILYTYYTRQLARSDYEPLAGFWLVAAETDQDTVLFMIRNHCKRSLDCWSRVEATVGGQTFKLRGFYCCEYPFFVQPYQTANGNFSVNHDIVGRSGFSAESLQRLERERGQIPIHLKVSFGYGLAGEEATWLPPVYYYYSLAQQRLVLDVGAVERAKHGIQL